MMYVAADGNYGDSEGMALIDTEHWTADDFDLLDSAHSRERVETAVAIAERIDRQHSLMVEFRHAITLATPNGAEGVISVISDSKYRDVVQSLLAKGS